MGIFGTYSVLTDKKYNNKLNREFIEIYSEVLGSVTALTTSHERILTSMNQDPPSIESN